MKYLKQKKMNSRITENTGGIMMKKLQNIKRVTGQYMAGFAMLLLISMGAATPAGAIPPLPLPLPLPLPIPLPIPFPVLVVTVNVTANAPDVLNGIDGQCSLREAITNINNGATTFSDCAPSSPTAIYGFADQINLPAGTYTTAIVNPAFPAAEEDLNANGDLDIRKSVTINGAGAATTIINANGFLTGDRVFDINPQGTAGVVVSITGVTISRGATIFSGGGIRNVGTLTLTDSIITKNSAQFSATFQGGGGIFNQGTLIVTSSTISGNSASVAGGGIFNISRGLLTSAVATISNSTISGNTAGNNGGGIASDSTTTVSITNSTISGNTSNIGGGVRHNRGIFTLKNTIVAGQTSGSDCHFAVGVLLTSTVLNSLDSDGSCGVGALSNMNPLLGPLANYGGPTKTHALLPGSPAIDAGDAATCTTLPVNSVDQRGVTRPQGAGCDIGAFELGPLPVLNLSLNKSSFVPRNTMILTATVTPGSTPTRADVYIAKLLPDGTLLVMQPGGSFSTARTPLLSNILVPSFNGPIITSTFTGAEPVGNYTWFAAFTQPGTMNIIGTLAAAPFTFTIRFVP